MQKKTMEELGRLSADDALAAQRHPVIIILDDVRSMHNVGSAFRTCDAFAATALYLCGYTPTPPHRDIHKTALGATETVPWQHFATVADAVAQARALGHTVLAVEQAHNSISLENLQTAHSGPLALVFGNEVSGVNDDIIRTADGCVEIPQWGAKHSLNISVSIGIVLWELVRPGQ